MFWQPILQRDYAHCLQTIHRERIQAMASNLQGTAKLQFSLPEFTLTHMHIHPFQALVLLEYLIKNGSERVVDDARSHVSMIKVMRNFYYIDDKGKDEGLNGKVSESTQ